ncbi:branched-chain amino acid ABC transporter permease [Propionivibrio sp.]|jgi:branched-chain amino acid transport system permease protein|uniref:branched-chain amino acid ABC transporter permease n=1 Tax=Propionivibrio sp. TaxID=2212460 RepID=UPI0039E25C7B
MLQNIFFGLSLGAVYSLIAVGFALVFNILKFSNFSHGGVMSFTAYAGYLAFILLFDGHISGPSMFLAIVFTAAIVGALTAVGIERVGFRRLRRNQAPVIYYFISSITLGILLENVITIFASSNFYSYPVFFNTANIDVAGLSFSVVDFVTLFFSCSALGLLLLVLYRSKLGLAVRTVSFDVNTASLMGIDPDRVVLATFAMSGALGGISGVFLGMNYSLYPQLGQLVVKGFIASVIGGLGSITGAVAGAFLLGIVEVALIGLVGSGWTPACVFVVMLVFLLLRPRGISGVIVQEKA